MNGVGQQQARHQGPGTPGNQMSMFVPQNFPGPHENYGQMNHPRPNGRPAFMLPQGPTPGQAQRFCPPSMPMVRNGMPYPATPHSIPPVALQQSHPNMQQTPGQNEMNMSLFQGGQPQDGSQMDFNATPVIYPNMNSQPHIFQSDVNGIYGRPVVMLRYPQFMPQVQLFQTRPVPVQVPGGQVQTPMQHYPAQVVMNQQMLQQQQQQASDMRQDASTPQTHHVTQFIPNMGFNPENAPFYYSPHPNIAQPPSIMSGQQPIPFPSYLQHAPAQVSQTPIQTPLNQGPSKHAMNKPYIMYRDEYSRSLQQGVQSTGSSGTLNRKEKRTIKIINPNTNEEVDLSAISKSDVAGAFQKQVKEVADVTALQTMLATPKSAPPDDLSDDVQHKPLSSFSSSSSENVRSDYSLVNDQASSLSESAALIRGDELSMESCEADSQELVARRTLRDTFSSPMFHADENPGVVQSDVMMVEDVPEELKPELEVLQSDEVVSEISEDQKSCSSEHACDVSEPASSLVVVEVPVEVKEDDEEDDDDDEDLYEDAGKKNLKKSGKKVEEKRELTGQTESSSSEAAKAASENTSSSASVPEDIEQRCAERPSTPHQLEEFVSEVGEESLGEKEESIDVLLTSTVSSKDEETYMGGDTRVHAGVHSGVHTGVHTAGHAGGHSGVHTEVHAGVHPGVQLVPSGDLDDMKHSKSENDITAPQEDFLQPMMAPSTNGLHRGRRVYSREFLMNLRDCPEALKKLPTISSDLADIIKPMSSSFKRESSAGALSAMGMRGGGGQPMNFNDFSSLFIRSSSQQNRLPKKPSQKRDYQQQSQQQRIINVALNHDVQLHTSEQAWKPSNKAFEALSGDEAVNQSLYKKTRSILNKLTPQNFETLLKQIKELQITTEDRLAGCMDLVFEKAISEPNFCVAYAQMAFNISSMKVPSKDSPSEVVSFRKLLLNRCQTEFEKDKIDELELERRQKEIDECESEERKKILILEKNDTMRRARRRSLGNIRFIGELFKMKMLTEKIMFDCLTKLMKTDDEDSIECLCWLIRTIGKDLDHGKNKRALDSLFAEIAKKSSNKIMTLRTRFMLQDIIELRDNNWVPRRVDVNPKTIEQIHKEAQQEEIQKHAMINQSPQLVNSYPPPMQSQKGNMDMMANRGNRYHGGPRGGHQVNEDGWSTYQPKSGGRGGSQPLDHSKLKMIKQDSSDIKLGPCRPATWSQGAGSGSSSGGSQFQSGSRHSSQESEKSSSSNRFSAIGNMSESFDYNRQNRPMYKDSSRNQFHRMHPESGYGSLPLYRNADRSSRPNSGSRNASRESSVSREASNRASPVVMAYGVVPAPLRKMPPPQSMVVVPPPVVKDPPHFNKDVFKRKTECIVDEYVTILDDKEALLSTQELRMNVQMMSHFVYTVVNHVIEKSSKELKHAGHLLSHLLSNNAVDLESFTMGLKEALLEAPDLEIDIPKIWDCFVELLASMILKSPACLPPISQAIVCLKPAGKAGTLMAGCLLKVSESLGCQKTVALWNGTRVNWSDFTDENVVKFVEENKLESLSVVSSDLLKMMNSQTDIDPMFMWINKHIAPNEHSALFIRSLATAACLASLQMSEGGRYEIKDNVLKRYTILLNRYIDHMSDREAQALFAIQALVHSLDHPPHMLNGFFHLLYDVDLISEDAFHEWKNSNDPTEQNGKGVATAATKAFFQWLQESVEEEDTS